MTWCDVGLLITGAVEDASEVDQQNAVADAPQDDSRSDSESDSSDDSG